jgi:hypothetical protein
MIHIHQLASDIPPPAPRPSHPSLKLADTAMTLTQDELRRLSDGQCEAFAIWAGRATDDFAFISHLVTFDCPADRDWVTVPSGERAELATALRRDRLLAFAELHTHPSSAFLSDVDRAHPFSSRPGFYAVVIPDFAAGEPGHGWRAYEPDADDWMEVACRDRFSPWPL